MTCPRCGGSAHALVSPGVAECRSGVSLPTGAHPSGAHGATHMATMCGQRYQVPNNATGEVALCSCGMQSVGACTSCGRSVCLDDLGRFDGRVLCREHYQEIIQKQAADAKLADTDAFAALQSSLSRVTRSAVAASPDLILEHRVTGAHGDLEGLTQAQVRALAVGRACPEHGSVCLQVLVTTTGRLIKRPNMATCRMPVWLLSGADGVNGDGRIVWNFRGAGFGPGVPAFSPDVVVVKDLRDADMLSPRAEAPLGEHLRRLTEALDQRLG
jgi:hypothetical protein